MGLSDFDTRNHAAGTAIYALPFKGNRLVSGYRLTTIVQYQTGNPVNFVASSDGFNGISGLIRPNLLGRIPAAQAAASGCRQRHYIFANPAGWPTAAGLRPDELHAGMRVPDCRNAGRARRQRPRRRRIRGWARSQRNAGIGPGFADVDLSGEKETKIFEGLSFTLRADAFDILNHPNFGQPSANVQASTFGQISATRFATSDGGSSRQLQISGKFVF